jgi:hypothetical protein
MLLAIHRAWLLAVPRWAPHAESHGFRLVVRALVWGFFRNRFWHYDA